MQAIKFYGKSFSANPFKVEVILKELGLAYESIIIPFSDVKNPEYTAINPNGRLPSIHDPNTGITLWESGAIIEYLIDQYDKDRKLSFAPGSTEAYHTKQWLYFQTSGQGPYYGQFGWFVKFHAEQVPSAIARYAGEINRVSGVLDGWLAKQKQEFAEADIAKANGPWLVGNRLSYADLAFVQWHRVAILFSTREQFDEANYPNLKDWIARMVARDSVQKVIEENPTGK